MFKNNFQGQFAFSEPETRSVRDFISQQQGRIKTFMTFHRSISIIYSIEGILNVGRIFTNIIQIIWNDS